MTNLRDYLSNGSFETFIPGQSSAIELDKTSAEFDAFLQKKESNNFVFISYDDLSNLGPINGPEEERIFLDSNEEASMQLMTDAGEQDWLYYMGGFRPNSNWGSVGGLFILNVDEETIKAFMSKAGHNWFVKGAIGQPATLVEWS